VANVGEPAPPATRPLVHHVTGRFHPNQSLVVARPGDPDAIVTAFGVFNPSPADAASIISRNTARQAGRVDVSLSIMKRLGRGFTSNVDATNLFNHTHRTVFNGVLGSPDFGQATQALPARRIEVGVTKSF
jgi:hypothetical protein